MLVANTARMKAGFFALVGFALALIRDLLLRVVQGVLIGASFRRFLGGSLTRGFTVRLLGPRLNFLIRIQPSKGSHRGPTLGPDASQGSTAAHSSSSLLCLGTNKERITRCKEELEMSH